MLFLIAVVCRLIGGLRKTRSLLLPVLYLSGAQVDRWPRTPSRYCSRFCICLARRLIVATNTRSLLLPVL
jgi:hypothetical protein